MSAATHHFTMLSLGTITAHMPDGQVYRQPLNFAFSGSSESLRNDKARQATINELIQENAAQCAEQLRLDGALDVTSTLKLVEQVL